MVRAMQDRLPGTCKLASHGQVCSICMPVPALPVRYLPTNTHVMLCTAAYAPVTTKAPRSYHAAGWRHLQQACAATPTMCTCNMQCAAQVHHNPQRCLSWLTSHFLGRADDNCVVLWFPQTTFCRPCTTDTCNTAGLSMHRPAPDQQCAATALNGSYAPMCQKFPQSQYRPVNNLPDWGYLKVRHTTTEASHQVPHRHSLALPLLCSGPLPHMR